MSDIRALQDAELARLSRENAALENECFAQAKAEINGHYDTGFDWVRAVAKRAQEIKAERMANNGR